MLFFPVKLFRDELSLYVVVALPYFRKRGPKVPMLYYFDPIGSYGDEADVLDKGIGFEYCSTFCGAKNSGPKLIKMTICLTRGLFL
jgi:hypothetical protein